MKTQSQVYLFMQKYKVYFLPLLLMFCTIYVTGQTYTIYNASSTPGVNGVYSEDGSFNSVPKYTNGSYTMFYANQSMKWAIVINGTDLSTSDFSSSPFRYSSIVDETTPPVRGWHHGGNTTGVPGEYVAVVLLNSIGYNKHFFVESADDDGTIKDTVSIYLYADAVTFTGSNDDDFITGGKAAFTNLPAGLTGKVVRKSDTKLVAYIEGTAVNSNMIDNVNDLTLTFNNSAVSNNDISVIGDSEMTFRLMYQNKHIISGTTSNPDASGEYMLEGLFNENPYYKNENGNYYLMTKSCYPAWIIRAHDNVHPLYSSQIRYEWPVNRQWHNGGFFYTMGENLTVGMENSILYNSYTFVETEANDGTFSDSIKITYYYPTEGRTFSGTNGDDFVTDGKINVSNTPSGLTPVVTRFDDHTLYAKLTGTADNHEITDKINNLVFDFQAGAFNDGGIFASNDHSKDSLGIIYMQKYIIVDTTDYTKESNGTYIPYDMIHDKMAFRQDNGYYLLNRDIASCMWSVLVDGATDAIYSTEADEDFPPDTSWRKGDWDGRIVARIVVFKEQPWLCYQELEFREAESGNGTFENTIDITINNAGEVIFDGTADEDFINSGKVQVLNLPEGISATVLKVSDSLVRVTLTDSQVNNYTSDDDVNDVIIMFSDDAFNTTADLIKFTEEYNVEISFTGISASKDNMLGNAETVITPNPASQFIDINIQIDDGNPPQYKLFNLVGNIVEEGKLLQNRIDISEKEEGIYMIMIELNDEIITEKVIIQ